MHPIRALFIAMMVLTVTAGCTRNREAPPAETVRISSTDAYRSWFGPPPTTDKGTCYAFVVFFPSARQPDKVIPFPFFTFDQTSLKRVAIQRLVAGLGDIKSYRGEILQPFPAGTRLLDLSEQGGILTLNFSNELQNIGNNETAKLAIADALHYTGSQFPGVKGVRIEVAGKETGWGKMVELPVLAIREPSPPRLLSVTAVKEKGASQIEAVNAYFDRPVEIRALQMIGADGKPFSGDIYHSVFDMAAVLKPADASRFQAGMPVKVRWDVTDKLGRHAAGESDETLEVKEH
jgi:hypothetical protein